jgi:integrase
MPSPYKRGKIHGILDHEYRMRPVIDKATGQPRIDPATKQPVTERYRHQIWIPVSRYADVRDEKLREYIKDKDRQRANLPRRSVPWKEVRDRYERYVHTYNKEGHWGAVSIVMRSIERIANPQTIADLTPEIGETIIRERKAQNASWETINKDVTILKHFGKMLTLPDWYGLRASPFETVRRMPQVKNRAPLVPTDEEIHKLMFETFPYLSKWYIAAAISLYTGFREGAVCVVEWEDINWAKRLIRTLEKPQYDFMPKGYKEHEWPIHPKLFELLKHMYDRAAKKTGLVLTRDDGTPISSKTMSAMFGKFMRGRFRRGLTFHKFRHAFATKIGVLGGAAAVKSALAHSSLKTTDRYVGMDMDLARRITEQIDYGIPSLISPQKEKDAD